MPTYGHYHNWPNEPKTITEKELSAITEAITQRLGHPELFRAWVESCSDTDILGIPRDARWCPVYKYLDLYHGPYISHVSLSGVSLDVQGEYPLIDLPDWARGILRDVDRRFVKGGINKINKLVPTYTLIRKRDMLLVLEGRGL